MISEQYVIHKVKMLLDERGIMLKKLGDILPGSSDDQQAALARARAFFRGQRKITLQDINALAQFFNIPAEEFIHESNEKIMSSISSQTQISGKGNISTIKTGNTESSDIEAFLALPEDQRKAFLEFLKSRN